MAVMPGGQKPVYPKRLPQLLIKSCNNCVDDRKAEENDVPVSLFVNKKACLLLTIFVPFVSSRCSLGLNDLATGCTLVQVAK